MTRTQPNGGDLWIRRLHEAPDAEVRLLCCPHAGGSASFFFALSEALRPAVEVLAVQYPGRQDRRAEPGIDDLDLLVDRVFEALRPWLGPPLAVFGHSMGAVVAFELARRLEREGKPEGLKLFVSSRRAAALRRQEDVHHRDDAGVIAELRALDGTDDSLLHDEEVLRMLLPAVRSDFRAIERYRYQPGPPLRSPITALCGDLDPRVRPDEARAWAEHTCGSFECLVFPGGHFYLVTGLDAVAAAIAERLLEGA